MKKRKKHKGPKELLHGLVLSVLGKGYEVAVDETLWRCRVRGRLFLGERATRPVVGDRVLIEERKGEAHTGIICGIEERSSQLSRRFPETGREQVLAANIDQVMICVAIKDPPFRAGLVDRYLVTCQACQLRPVLVLNKIDLATEEEVAAIVAEFGELGVEVMPCSALQSRNIEALREALAERNSVFTGPSGAGKSSLLNCIAPGLNLSTGSVNEVTGRGRHTTTVSKLIPLSSSGYVMDTPGIREFALWGITPEELPRLFVEFQPWLRGCRFRDCQHVREPDCGVKDALAEGHISRRRYESYLLLREELCEVTPESWMQS